VFLFLIITITAVATIAFGRFLQTLD